MVVLFIPRQAVGRPLRFREREQELAGRTVLPGDRAITTAAPSSRTRWWCRSSWRTPPSLRVADRSARASGQVMTPGAGSARAHRARRQNASAAAAARGASAGRPAALGKAAARLGLHRLPHRIECFDIGTSRGQPRCPDGYVHGRRAGALALSQFRSSRPPTTTSPDVEVLTGGSGARPRPDDRRGPPPTFSSCGGKGHCPPRLAALGRPRHQLGRADSMTSSLAK